MTATLTHIVNNLHQLHNDWNWVLKFNVVYFSDSNFLPLKGVTNDLLFLLDLIFSSGFKTHIKVQHTRGLFLNYMTHVYYDYYLLYSSDATTVVKHKEHDKRFWKSLLWLIKSIFRKFNSQHDNCKKAGGRYLGTSLGEQTSIYEEIS